jgi:nitrogen fixation-related uncharacterized protein/nucleotide-binding universal stress UspA family protein
MQPVSCILVVVDRSPTAADALAKAVRLARKFKATVDLFMCDTEHAYTLSQAYVPAGVEEARGACIADAYRYLETLRQSASAPDVNIKVDAACESPLYESIVRKVMRAQPDLVIKNAHGPKGQRVRVAGIVLVTAAAAALIWAVDSGQYDGDVEANGRIALELDQTEQLD